MYNVNTEKITDILNFMEQELLGGLREVMKIDKQALLEQKPNGLACERMFHLFIEGMTDIGNLLIDGFIMRDPGSYEDIVDIMEDEQVYPHEAAEIYRKLILLRKPLVFDYTQMIRGSLYDFYQQHQQTMEQYPMLIRAYLKKELW
jgi:uncharacterized protein YutE (UPF0331/DUF86 family)